MQCRVVMEVMPSVWKCTGEFLEVKGPSDSSIFTNCSEKNGLKVFIENKMYIKYKYIFQEEGRRESE